MFVAACAPYQGNFRERGIAAAGRGDWEAAYRFSEDALLSDDSSKRLDARQFILSNPKIYQAAAQTFHATALNESIQKYGETSAYSIEENRLLAYKTVASSEDYGVAANTFDRIFDEAKKRKEIRARELERMESDQKLERAQRAQRLRDIEAAARITCRSELECRKAFALTEIFAADYSDMKIQISTGNIIETYNPTKSFNIGLKVVKTPLQGESAEISLRVVCAADARLEYCEERKLAIYEAYPTFLRNRLFD